MGLSVLQVGVCLVTERSGLTLAELRTELRSLIAAHKLPRKLILFEGEIPRNVSQTHELQPLHREADSIGNGQSQQEGSRGNGFRFMT